MQSTVFHKLPLLIFLVFATHGKAEEVRYISDELRVPLRNSACSSCAIVHRGLVAGTRLTLHGVENGWANVTTSGGETGWLPEQYLVAKPIARDRLDAAQANTRMLSEENADLKNRVTTLEEQNEKLAQENASLTQQTKELETELLTIRKVSGNAMALQDQNEELIKQNRMLQSEVDVLTATRDQLASDDSQKWFLYGGITVCLGALLAILLPRLKPRRRFSEWA